jgi:hypothetical protein
MDVCLSLGLILYVLLLCVVDRSIWGFGIDRMMMVMLLLMMMMLMMMMITMMLNNQQSHSTTPHIRWGTGLMTITLVQNRKGVTFVCMTTTTTTMQGYIDCF